ncbi:glutamate--tRNA ligase [Candidatus Woesearchaeota archaeon]|nr:glutamate--tRNA ligase [Candidatus Woesearchaeota archaeon]
MDIEDKIRKLALINAGKFGGKANTGSVIGAFIQENPKFKDKVKEYAPLIEKFVSDINAMGVAKQKEELDKYGPITAKKKEKKTGLKDLPNVAGKVVMRFEPSPSGLLHIGHSIVLSLNYEYVKKYGGQLILRIADTNPENIDHDAYSQIHTDANWLCENEIKKVLVQSDRLEIYYKYAKKLIEKGAAYICTCDPEKFRYMLSKQKPCPCRNNKENMDRYKKMFTSYKQGDAVMRFKSDIKDKNPAMRDFPLLRINETEHPRQGKKYRVWPLMNLAVAVDDMENKITHTLRAKDHADNAKRQALIHKAMAHKTPQALFVGRINFEGFELSTTKTREKIEKGEYSGWDDPRLPFLLALKKRGYKPGALRKFAVSLGVSLTDKTVPLKEFFKQVNAFNKEILEDSNRYFFVKDPVEIKIKGAPAKKVLMELHPDHLKRGSRKLIVKEDFIVSKEDYEHIKNGKLFRLIDCLNAKYSNKEFVMDSLDYTTYKKQGGHIIHWLPLKDNLKVEVYMDDGSIAKGYGEPGIKDLKKGDVVQFERFGFVTFDLKQKDKYIFRFAHK